MAVAVAPSANSPSVTDANVLSSPVEAAPPPRRISSKAAGSNLLCDKITAALTHEGYDHHSVAKVKKLVLRNTVSARHGGLNDKMDLKEEVEGLLTDMLSTGGVQVNSNEVVVVVEFEGLDEWKRREVEDVKNQIVDVLGEKCCIWPVRVYVAKAQEAVEMDVGFKVSLLNVVNTDVGSPSMVQLLEHHCFAKSWDAAIISTEAWGQRSLLWRSDRDWKGIDDVSEAKEPQVTQQEMAQEYEYVTPVLEDVKFESEAGNLSGSVVDVSKPDVSASEDEYVVDDTPEQPVKLVEHPAVAELAARDAARAHIQHPTWQHADEGASLIELIKMHASQSGLSDDAEIIDRPEQLPKGGSDGSFEIV